jgi:hypothetical protein
VTHSQMHATPPLPASVKTKASLCGVRVYRQDMLGSRGQCFDADADLAAADGGTLINVRTSGVSYLDLAKLGL